MTTDSVASKVPFYQFANLLEKIYYLPTKDQKKAKLLKEFIDQWRAFDTKLHVNDSVSGALDTFFPAMRLLLPHLDRDREAYGIKEHTLAKLYIELLGLGKESPAAQKLLNFRAPKNAKADAGDFASVAYWVLKPRCTEKGTLSVKEINDCLDGVSQCNANKDKGGVRKHLLHALRNTSAHEQKWLIRIIMRELKIGLSQKTAFAMFHEDAEDLYNVKMSLDKVCTMLKDPKIRLHEIEIAVFTPFQPMLAEGGKQISEIERLIGNKTFFVEIKYDGERMQLHKKGETYKLFSRSGNEYTHVYGADKSSGNFTPYIANSFKRDVVSCVLDGEMVGYNPETKMMGSKGENFDIKSLTAGRYQPMMCVFDILEYNGHVLSNRPLRERREILAEVFEPVEGRFALSAFTEKRTCQDVADLLNDAIDRREEGIMVKDPDSIYKPATRKAGWYKIKPEYVHGLMDELDVLVVGGFFGVGSRSHMMSHFLCAVAVPPAKDGVANDEKPKKFHTFCKVGSGYSHSELFEFNRRLAEHWTPFDKKNSPTWLEMASGFKQRPDAYIQPDKSAILQIKAAEIVDSDQFRTGCTLRFPRVEKIRDDRPWHTCMTTVELEDMRNKSSGKLVGRYADAAVGEEESKRKRTKVGHTTYVKPTVATQFRGIDVSSVKKISEAFSAKEFCVISGSQALSKADAERRLVELGASIVQNPAESTYCVLTTDKMTVKLRNIISKGVYDVVNIDWLQRCVEHQALLPWTPEDMIHASARTSAAFVNDYDQYGDSYYDDTNVDKLKKIFSKMPAVNPQKSALSVADIAELEMKYFPHDSSAMGLFRQYIVYVDRYLSVGDGTTAVPASSLEMVSLDLRLGGATVTESVTDAVSHIVVNMVDLSRVDLFKYYNRNRSGKRFHIVRSQWVYDSIGAGKLLPEIKYTV